MSLLLVLLILFGASVCALLLTPLEFSGQSHPWWRVNLGYPWLKVRYQGIKPEGLTLRVLGLVSLRLPWRLFSLKTPLNLTIERQQKRKGETVKRGEGKGEERKRKMDIPSVVSYGLPPLFRLAIKVFSAIKVKRIRLKGSIATDDPALTGWIYAGIVPIYGIAPHLRTHFDVTPHFFASRSFWEGEWKITVLPIVLVVIFLEAGGIVLWRKLMRLGWRS